MSVDEERDESHLTHEVVAAYLDGSLGLEKRSEVERHLAECRMCRKEVVQLARILRRRPPWKRWYVVTPVAAAAVLLLILIGSQARTPRPGESRLRSPASGVSGEPVSRLAVVSPAQSEVASTDSIVFAWRGAAADANYRFTITDASGEVVWEATTSDTIVVPPPNVSLAVGHTYYWYVDGLFLDGRSLTSGVRKLTLVANGE